MNYLEASKSSLNLSSVNSSRRSLNSFVWPKNNKDELLHHKVCSAGNIELAKLLGSSSGFVEVDDNGKGPLQIAFEKGHIDIVKNIILNFKGHIDNRFARKKCLTIFDQVCFTEDEELIKLMMDEWSIENPDPEEKQDTTLQ